MTTISNTSAPAQAAAPMHPPADTSTPSSDITSMSIEFNSVTVAHAGTISVSKDLGELGSRLMTFKDELSAMDPKSAATEVQVTRGRTLEKDLAQAKAHADILYNASPEGMRAHREWKAAEKARAESMNSDHPAQSGLARVFKAPPGQI
jgi:hypothetical protein